jgi:hypothetical protein
MTCGPLLTLSRAAIQGESRNISSPPTQPVLSGFPIVRDERKDKENSGLRF